MNVRETLGCHCHGPTTVHQWRIERGWRGGGAPYWLIFLSKNRFFRVKSYISLCAFEINENGADKLSSAPFSIFLSQPLDYAERLRDYQLYVWVGETLVVRAALQVSSSATNARLVELLIARAAKSSGVLHAQHVHSTA